MDEGLLNIVIEAAKRVRGTQVIDVAREMLSQVPKKYHRELAAQGFASHIYQALSAQRRASITIEEREICQRAGCEEKPVEGGYCQKHYDEWLQQEREYAREEEANYHQYLKKVSGIFNEFQTVVERQTVEKLRAIVLQGADGSMRSLFDFTQADLERWETSADKRAIAWDRRREWFVNARDKLATHGVEAIADLPADALLELGEQAVKVWENDPVEEEAQSVDERPDLSKV